MVDNLKWAYNMYINNPLYFNRFVQNIMVRRDIRPLRFYCSVRHGFASCTPKISGILTCDTTNREYKSFTDWYNAVHNKSMKLKDTTIFDMIYLPTYATLHQLFNTLLSFEFNDITYRTYKLYNYVCNIVGNRVNTIGSFHLLWKDEYHYNLEINRIRQINPMQDTPAPEALIEAFESETLHTLYVIHDITHEKIPIRVTPQIPPIQSSPIATPPVQYTIDVQPLIHEMINRSIWTTKQESYTLWVHIQNLQSQISTYETRISVLESMIGGMFQTCNAMIAESFASPQEESFPITDSSEYIPEQ